MQGLQIFDEQGDLVLGVTDRITKILGEIVIDNSVNDGSGWVDVPAFASGTPFFFCVGNEVLKSGYVDNKGWKHGFWPVTNERGTGYYPAYEIPAYQVNVTVSGIRLTWSVSKYARWWINVKNGSFRILYGVY